MFQIIRFRDCGRTVRRMYVGVADVFRLTVDLHGRGVMFAEKTGREHAVARDWAAELLRALRAAFDEERRSC